MSGQNKLDAKKMRQLYIIAALILLILGSGLLVYNRFASNKTNNFFITNKYYSFKLQTPKSWMAEEKTIYSEGNIAQILSECQKDKLGKVPTYEIGKFRFDSQRYPQNFGDPGYFPDGLSSGAILEITVNCISDGMVNKIASYGDGNLKIGGEQALEGTLNLPVFGGTIYFSFLHNNFQYEITEYIYIAPTDKGSEVRLRDNYAEIFKKIVSSFKFNQ